MDIFWYHTLLFFWLNTSKKNICCDQSAQTFAARVVSGMRKFDHIAPILKQLHWLPVNLMLLYKDGVSAHLQYLDNVIDSTIRSFLNDQATNSTLQEPKPNSSEN